MSDTCFHCGQPVAPGAARELQIGGVNRRLCCAGCEVAARLILGQGLERYYQFRALPPPDAAGGAGLGGSTDARGARPDWAVYDRDSAQRRYTHRAADGACEVSLHVDGLHCAACAWLIENSLGQLGGVREVQVNPGTARAEVRFDPQRASLSRILQGIDALGYRPQPLNFLQADAEAGERREALKRLAVAGFGMMQVMSYAASLYLGAFDGMSADLQRFMRLVSLIVSTPVVLYAARPFFDSAWRSVRARRPGVDVPVALSIGAAYGCSVWATLIGGGPVYFDSAVMFTFFLLLGRYIEGALRRRAGLTHDALVRLLPHSVLRVRDTVAERVIPEELSEGDIVRVLPGERLAADGVVLAGRTEVDESLLTGEATPRPRAGGDALIAGTLNLNGVIEMRVTRLGTDSTLAVVSRLLERARAAKPRLAAGADRVAAWFVSAVLAIAAAAALYWWHVDAARAFPTVLAVLVVTCPCALSLAAPAALAAATTRLAREGLLVTRSDAIESLARIDCAVFDKTGTLTRGTPRLDAVRVLRAGMTRARCLAIAAGIESHSEHPLAHAFGRIRLASDISDVQVDPGRGMRARVSGRWYRIGRHEYVLAESNASEQTLQASERSRAGTRTRVLLGDELGPVAEFVIGDAPRAGAGEALRSLTQLGVEPRLASGDSAASAAAVAARLGGIAFDGELKPEGKVALVQRLQAQGRRVLMVGDGINDAPVLAAADVSVAIASGTELAKVSADLVLLGASLAPVASAVRLARRTWRIVRQNLAWAVLYNATAIPLAAAGRLDPWMAAAGMSASSLLVVGNALRLLRARPGAASTNGGPRVRGWRARAGSRRRTAARLPEIAARSDVSSPGAS